MTDPSLTFLGAAGTVTGSRFLVETAGARVLVDAGLFQGLAELRRRNWEPVDFDPRTLDVVVLTHAHLDHTGYLPRLVRDGFRGRVVCTEETAALAAIVLRDSAHLQQEDADFANEHGFSKHHPALPLYDDRDVEQTLPLLDPVPLGKPVRLADGVDVVLHAAGHILGSSTVSLEADGRSVLFSGDLGRRHHPLLRPPEDPPAVDTIVVESTYGARTHPVPDPDMLAGAIRRTVERGGTVLLPAFAVDRTELVLIELKRLVEAGEIPRIPVYADSPMALATLDVYRRAIADGSPQLQPGLAGRAGHGDLFDPGILRVARTVEESKSLNRPDRPCLIVSASGMASGGRVIHHLQHQLPDPRNTVVLTGYQAEGTRGRQLLDGAAQVKIHGRYVPVRAEVVSVPDFSVHADSDELVAWLGRAAAPPSTVYVVHGEADSSRELARRIGTELGWCAVVPKLNERVLVG